MTGALDALPSHARDLARRTLEWCDRFWDEEFGLPAAPPGAGFSGAGVPRGPLHLVPPAARYAFGLLLREAPGDRARAERALATLLGLQYDTPGTPWHGTFARFAESPTPRAGAVVWADYDPNWRQFLGNTFLEILARFEAILPRSLVAGLDAAIVRTVEGEPPDRIPASYANIALLHASLLTDAGARFDRADWIRNGEAVGRAAAAHFDRHGAFVEYNSPTYYGVDLLALSRWTSSASSEVLAREGERLTAALWRDAARWYHAGLSNLCAPYTRCYGLDMRRYVSNLALFLWRELGFEHAPLPPLEPHAAHGHDLFLGPVVAVLGAPIPDDVRAAFLRFAGPRSVHQRIDDAPRREATGHLEAAWMAGAEHCEADLSWWDQYVGAALHWRRPEGAIGWLAVRAPGPVEAVADAQGLRLAWRGAESREAHLRLSHPEASLALGADPVWRLPGITLRLEGRAGRAEDGTPVLRARRGPDGCELAVRVGVGG